MSEHALQLAGVTKRFGPIEIIQGVDLDIRKGERHAIIGPNGAGKSTLFNLISGILKPTAGEITLNGRRISGKPAFQINRMGLSRSFQVSNIFSNMSVRDNIRCGVLHSQGIGYSFLRPTDGIAAVSERTEEILHEVGLGGKADLYASELPYADQRALEIGITIAGRADVILLDEPTAGMSSSETERAIELIERATRGKTLIVVEHDMGVVFGLADRISVLVYGKILETGTPAEIRGSAKVRDAYLGHEADHIRLEGAA